MNNNIIITISTIVLIIIIITITIYYFINNTYTNISIIKSKTIQFYNKRNKEINIKTKVPLNVYMTWGELNIPNDMYDNINYNITNNSEFDFYIYDNDKCREFIIDNYDSDVLYAYDSLIPGAYKADLWRYCILYKKGGVYIDIKYKIVSKLLKIVQKYPICFVKDRYSNWVYNGIMIAPPELHVFKLAINKIVQNVKNKYYGTTPLEPTGPKLLGSILEKNYDIPFALIFTGNSVVDYDDNIIYEIYSTYRIEQLKFQKTQHYDKLWREKNIYLQ